jgi:hypothetical protein
MKTNIVLRSEVKSKAVVVMDHHVTWFCPSTETSGHSGLEKWGNIMEAGYDGLNKNNHI